MEGRLIIVIDEFTIFVMSNNVPNALRRSAELCNEYFRTHKIYHTLNNMKRILFSSCSLFAFLFDMLFETRGDACSIFQHH